MKSAPKVGDLVKMEYMIKGGYYFAPSCAMVHPERVRDAPSLQYLWSKANLEHHGSKNLFGVLIREEEMTKPTRLLLLLLLHPELGLFITSKNPGWTLVPMETP